MERDALDLGSADLSTLFRKIFIPTFLGMVMSAAITITDGIFVGQGVGSHGIAAVNIVAPLFMIAAGIGLMFGVGASVVASIHLSQNKVKAANINITQALIASLVLMSSISLTIMIFRTGTAYMLGSSDTLLPQVLEYMNWIVLFFPFNMLMCCGLFIIRLDGSPVFAMLCSMIPALLNVILDYVFIFPCQMGLKGAAIASSLSVAVGGVMIAGYLVFGMKTMHLYRLKISLKSFRLTLRNLGYQIRLGFSALLGEAAVACLMLVGNIVFMHRLGDDGVAAFSVACYCLPIVFMLNNAIAQSAQPIISYNFGAGNSDRIRGALRMSIVTAVICGLGATALMIICNSPITSLFLGNDGTAHDIAVNGMPLFASGYLFFAFNIVAVGYYQSVEQAGRAMIYTLLRGFVFMTAAFVIMPSVAGTAGMWLAVPCSEMLTSAVIATVYVIERRNRKTVSK